eukprot:CAMPEP_0177210492 /NCGR_PEP_ID=MMETSP0367-20130122/31577_1 /TAXON_ID=447022 ORGANISM="Scrippsiella hangoei-like, Strain SHHI-4" /NCGR_SAMPLE_ID=MMETSP0367 /ASSEMBLY_ACC=CAM_ASM_000362 /LENGTH=76 /DNA_ID=CAMNT_0018659593 /DNA_START=71 /DNA_END=298 /DNA_ORIENTATION=-
MSFSSVITLETGRFLAAASAVLKVSDATGAANSTKPSNTALRRRPAIAAELNVCFVGVQALLVKVTLPVFLISVAT